MTQQTQQTYDPNDVLMGGGGAPGWKFSDPGDSHEGTVIRFEAKQEREYDPANPSQGAPKFFKSGAPIMSIVVEVQTHERDPMAREDDGRRLFYVEGRHLKDAVRDAVRASGATGLEVGGHLAVTFTHREDPMDKRSRKHWRVVYTPAGNAALMGGPTTPPPAQAAPAAAPQGEAIPAGYTPEVWAALPEVAKAAIRQQAQASSGQEAPF